MDALLSQIGDALHAASALELSTRRHTPWELVHAALGLGPNALMLDAEAGTRIPFVEYFRRGGPYLSESIYEPVDGGVIVRYSRNEFELQRHPNQFLACFAMMGIPLETSLTLENENNATVADLLNAACLGFDAREEVTFTLIVMAHYLPCDTSWKNAEGKTWSLRDLVSLEMAADRTKLACGGTHSLYGLGVSLKKMEEKWPTSDLCTDVRRRLQDEVARVRTAQSPNGSFPGSVLDVTAEDANVFDYAAVRLYSTGHTLEWLLVLVEGEELSEPWIRRAIGFLASTFLETNGAINAGTRYHAVHALRMYRDRVTRTEGAAGVGG